MIVRLMSLIIGKTAGSILGLFFGMVWKESGPEGPCSFRTNCGGARARVRFARVSFIPVSQNRGMGAGRLIGFERGLRRVHEKSRLFGGSIGTTEVVPLRTGRAGGFKEQKQVLRFAQDDNHFL
jgi:hypothetical protein